MKVRYYLLWSGNALFSMMVSHVDLGYLKLPIYSPSRCSILHPERKMLHGKARLCPSCQIMLSSFWHADSK